MINSNDNLSNTCNSAYINSTDWEISSETEPDNDRYSVGLEGSSEQRNFTGSVIEEIAKPRLDNKDWIEAHNAQKESIASGNVKGLLIGDSITKYVDQAEVASQPGWIDMEICNAGVSGDRLENVLWRVHDWKGSSSVKKVILAAGTNNLIPNSADQILEYTVEIHSILKEKFPNADVWIQSILPRLFVNPKVCQKIKDINNRLHEKFDQFFFNPHKDFITGNGRIKRNFFRRDGLHLSKLGTEKLASEIQKIMSDNLSNNDTLVVDKKKQWAVKYDKSMTFEGTIEGKKVDILVDTGSFVTLVNQDVIAESENIRVSDSSLLSIVGIGNIPKPVHGAVILEIKIGENVLPLKCYVVDNIKYSIVLGRDMLDSVMTGMDHERSTIFFRSGMSLDDIELADATACFLTKDITLEPNSVTQVEFDLNFDLVSEGNIVGNKELLRKGVIVMQSTLHRADNYCIVHNISSDPVKLKRNSVVATVEQPTHKSMSIWSADLDGPRAETIEHTDTVVVEESNHQASEVHHETIDMRKEDQSVAEVLILEECPTDEMEEQIQVGKKEDLTVSKTNVDIAFQIVMFLQLLRIAGFLVANILKMSVLFQKKAVSRKDRSVPQVDIICFGESYKMAQFSTEKLSHTELRKMIGRFEGNIILNIINCALYLSHWSSMTHFDGYPRHEP